MGWSGGWTILFRLLAGPSPRDFLRENDLWKKGIGDGIIDGCFGWKYDFVFWNLQYPLASYQCVDTACRPISKWFMELVTTSGNGIWSSSPSQKIVIPDDPDQDNGTKL
ncbi:hypothetical protein TNCV_777731 [Trichonephila clavipes]|nr:hypothetical protein TNCV_777731 [Trichonephila clavipes]